MSVVTVRGGVPWAHTYTITNAAPQPVALPFHALHLQLRVAGEAVKVFFTEEDATAGTDYLTVPVATGPQPWPSWEGPAEIGKFWLQSASVTPATVNVCAFQRRN